MKIIVCNNSYQEKWNDFIKNNSNDFGLLQSWQWGEFQNKLNKKIFRLAVIDDSENILTVAQIIKVPLRLGKSYFYIPRGPIMSQKSKVQSRKSEDLNLLFSEIKKLAKKEKVIFLRFDPAWIDNELIKNLKFVGQVQPQQTLILDLSKTEEELLKQMKSKTRYNIKVAQKHGIEILAEDQYFEDFWQLTQKTSTRQEITSHPKKYYQEMLKVLSSNGIAKIIVAKYQDKIIATNLVIFFNDWCVYLHGASNYDYRDKMAPYLLQWETIKKAKQQGKKYYDFWGVDEKKWPGVTRFKYGFAPNQDLTQYIGAWDEVYDAMWYNIYGWSQGVFKRLR